jgi:regulatory protein
MNDLEKFYNKALKFLSYRPRSEKEIIDKLKTKKAPEDVIKKVIKKLKEYKFVDDLEFARWWVEQRTTINLKAWRVIKFELKQKGIGEEIIQDSEIKAKDDLRIAQKLALKRMERYKNIDKKEARLKLMRYLASRGFNYDIIKQSIDEIFKKEV